MGLGSGHTSVNNALIRYRGRRSDIDDMYDEEILQQGAPEYIFNDDDNSEVEAAAPTADPNIAAGSSALTAS